MYTCSDQISMNRLSYSRFFFTYVQKIGLFFALRLDILSKLRFTLILVINFINFTTFFVALINSNQQINNNYLLVKIEDSMYS